MREVQLRAFFQWSHSGVFIPFFFGLAIAFALSDHFVLSDLFLASFGIWSICFWLTSDFLSRKRRALGARRIQKDPARLGAARMDLRRWKWGVSLGVVIFTMVWVVWVRKQQRSYELISLHGFLYPADDPNPVGCPRRAIRPGSVVFYLGQLASVTTTFPHTVLRIRGKDRIVVDRNSEGSIAVSLEVFGEDGKIVAEIRRNEFTVNPNNYFRIERKDASSLSVINQHNKEVLTARYLNPTAFKIDADLFYPEIGPLRIGGIVSSFCVSNAMVDVEIN